MIPPPPPAGLPVVSTRTRVLDHLHGFMAQETARGDIVFVRQSNGRLVEIAVIPVDENAKPFLRWEYVDPKLQALLDAELPETNDSPPHPDQYGGLEWDPPRPLKAWRWRKLDEENFPKELAKLLDLILAWYMENAGREAVVR